MTAVLRLACALVLLGIGACSERKPSHRVVKHHALLGVKTPALIERLKQTCPAETPSGEFGFAVFEQSVSCGLGGKVNHYDLSFDDAGRITDIRILHKSNVEIRQVFDAMIAPILPDDARDELQRSLAYYADQDGVTNFEFAKRHPYTVVSMSRTTLALGAVSISWRMREIADDE